MKNGSILIEDLEVWYHIGVPDADAWRRYVVREVAAHELDL